MVQEPQHQNSSNNSFLKPHALNLNCELSCGEYEDYILAILRPYFPMFSHLQYSPLPSVRGSGKIVLKIKIGFVLFDNSIETMLPC